MISFKKIFVLTVIVFSLVSCSHISSLTGEKQEVALNVFTGLPGENGRILAVKFDDTTNAHPQQGVEDADVVFVTQVEAGLTRLLGIYSSQYPDVIGPIRSARISDIDILAQFGKVGFAYSGAQSKLRPVLAKANLVNLSAERNPPTIYFNDENRIRPYAMMLKTAPLLAKAEGLDFARSIGYSHGEMSESSTVISSATIRWPNAKYEAVWNETAKKFDLLHDGNPNLNTLGESLGSNNLVIQIVEIHPSEYGDKFGGVTPKSTVIGSGKGYLLRDGRMTEVRWTRTDAISPTKWTLNDGSEAKFATGQVWFFLTDIEPKFASF